MAVAATRFSVMLAVRSTGRAGSTARSAGPAGAASQPNAGRHRRLRSVPCRRRPPADPPWHPSRARVSARPMDGAWMSLLPARPSGSNVAICGGAASGISVGVRSRDRNGSVISGSGTSSRTGLKVVVDQLLAERLGVDRFERHLRLVRFRHAQDGQEDQQHQMDDGADQPRRGRTDDRGRHVAFPRRVRPIPGGRPTVGRLTCDGRPTRPPPVVPQRWGGRWGRGPAGGNSRAGAALADPNPPSGRADVGHGWGTAFPDRGGESGCGAAMLRGRLLPSCGNS